MPKQPGGISKSDRMQALVDLLNRAGMLEKNEITQRIASILNVDEKKIERALYRDLNELVDSGKIKVCSKDSLGNIVEPDLADIKNFKNFWYTDKHSPFSITGIGYLNSFGMDVIFHPSLQKFIKCLSVEDILSSKAQFIFLTPGNPIGLFFDDEIKPFTVYMSRIESLSKEFIKSFYVKNGKRSIILQIHNNYFSRFQNDLTKNVLSLNFDKDVIINNSLNRGIKYIDYKLSRSGLKPGSRDVTGSISDLIVLDKDYNLSKDSLINLTANKRQQIKIGNFEFILFHGKT